MQRDPTNMTYTFSDVDLNLDPATLAQTLMPIRGNFFPEFILLQYNSGRTAE